MSSRVRVEFAGIRDVTGLAHRFDSRDKSESPAGAENSARRLRGAAPALQMAGRSHRPRSAGACWRISGGLLGAGAAGLWRPRVAPRRKGRSRSNSLTPRIAQSLEEKFGHRYSFALGPTVAGARRERRHHRVSGRRDQGSGGPDAACRAQGRHFARSAGARDARSQGQAAGAGRIGFATDGAARRRLVGRGRPGARRDRDRSAGAKTDARRRKPSASNKAAAPAFAAQLGPCRLEPDRGDDRAGSGARPARRRAWPPRSRGRRHPSQSGFRGPRSCFRQIGRGRRR